MKEEVVEKVKIEEKNEDSMMSIFNSFDTQPAPVFRDKNDFEMKPIQILRKEAIKLIKSEVVSGKKKEISEIEASHLPNIRRSIKVILARIDEKKKTLTEKEFKSRWKDLEKVCPPKSEKPRMPRKREFQPKRPYRRRMDNRNGRRQPIRRRTEERRGRRGIKRKRRGRSPIRRKAYSSSPEREDTASAAIEYF